MSNHPFEDVLRLKQNSTYDRDMRAIDTRFRGLENKVEKVKTDTASLTSSSVGGGSAPAVTINSISESGITIDGTVWSEVSITYTAPSDITNFAGVYAAVQNYRASTEIVKEYEHTFLGAAGASASFKFRLYRTNETITVYLISKNRIGGTRDDWQNAPSTTVLLDGNVSAPNAPTGLTATPSYFGVSLSWTENVESNLAAYDVYRNSANNSGTATKIATVQATKTGNASYEDSTANPNATNYYWVKAINTADLASAFSSVASNIVLGLSIPVGANQIQNGGFEITPNSGTGDSIAAFWHTPTSTNTNEFTFSRSTGTFEVGTAALQINLATNFSIAAGANDAGGIFSRAKIPPVSGQTYIAKARMRWDAAAALPAGLAVAARPTIRVYHTDGSFDDHTVATNLAQLTQLDAGATWKTVYAAYQLPLTPAVPYDYITCYVASYVSNATGAPISTSATQNWLVTVDEVELFRSNATNETAALNTTTTANIAQLSSVAGSTVISVAAFTLQFGFGAVSYNSGSVNPGAYGTYYVYCDDPGFGGGAVTYMATTSTQNITGAEGRIYIGKITTSAGSPGSGGGNGTNGCVEVGTPVEFYPDSEVTEEILPCNEWIEIPSPDGEMLYVHPETLVSVFKRAIHLDKGDLVELKEGRLMQLEAKPNIIQRASKKVKRIVEPWHTYFARGIRLHNVKVKPD